MPSFDAIDTLDWGAYATFTELAKARPGLLDLMQGGYYLGSYIVVGLIGGLAICVFLQQRRRRDALLTLLAFVAGALLLEIVQFLVPRARPSDAHNWLGTDGSVRDSYPAASVFLFALAMILLGSALWDLLGRGQRASLVVLAAALTVWVCMSQFFLALHFVSDVIGGLAGAALVGWIACRMMGANEVVPTPEHSPPSEAIQDRSHTHGIQK